MFRHPGEYCWAPSTQPTEEFVLRRSVTAGCTSSTRSTQQGSTRSQDPLPYTDPITHSAAIVHSSIYLGPLELTAYNRCTFKTTCRRFNSPPGLILLGGYTLLPSKMGLVTIHVADPRHGSRDFVCDAQLLLKHMGYFRPLAEGWTPGQDIELSVQCDVEVFHWLMSYVKASHTGAFPLLKLENCLQLLIASAFLQVCLLETPPPSTPQQSIPRNAIQN